MTIRAPSITAVLVLVTAFCGQVFAADAMMVTLEGGFKDKIQPFVQTYCVSCHGKDKPEAEFDITSFTTMSSVVKDMPRWDLVLERLKAKEMPPAKAKVQPTAEVRQQAIDWITSLRKYESDRNAGDPGPVLARRLSNAEYDYTIRDLTGVDIRPTKEFPVDPANEAGFDNSGESLAMSPALIKKYLDAARLVSEQIVFKPDGFGFAPHPAVTETDRDKYAVNRIVQFYKRQPTEYSDYFVAAWRYANRAALGKPTATLADAAIEVKVSPKYLERVWSVISGPKEEAGPIAAIQIKFQALPAPANAKEPETLRAECEKIRDFIVDLRPWVAKDFANFPARGIAAGSQTMVLWKDRQFAENRMVYAGNALEVNMTGYAQTVPVMTLPESDAAKAKYQDSFRRFCEVFPDAFVVSERGRMFLTNAREIENEKRNNTGRLLGAGFHSQMGYFRDDQPLCELILDEKGKAELDQLWRELDFITLAPFRQLKQFIWFERAEPPSYMYSPEFNSFRSEDDDIITEAKIKRMSEVYLEKAQRINVSEEAQAIVKDYFERMNASIRALETAQRKAEPSHLDSLLAFSERAYRRPLAQNERDSILAFYRSLRAQGLDHEESIRDTVISVLMSPYVLCRVDPSNKGDEVQALSDYSLANRLSYFLWSSMPDAELMSHAAAGDLRKPEVLLAQTKRMLLDRKVLGFATEFGGNWLDFRRFEEHNAVDRERFPEFTNELRSAMFEEPLHFIVDVVQKDRSVLDFIYGQYTFVNPILAKHYGMPELNVSSKDEWVRVDDAGKYQRGGLLPMSVFMTKNAPGLRTSPVKRGYWVVRRLLGEYIPAPPPNVPVLPSDETKLGDLTLRQTLAKHREDKACSTCHEHFDSVGVVFEGFGPVGEFRTKDLAGRPVEISATFPDGSEGTGLEGLRKYIRDKRQPDFIDNLCRKMLVYALGRSIQPSDDALVAEMKQKLSAGDYRFQTMVQTIVTSKQFLNKRGATAVTKE